MKRCLCIHGHFYQPLRENPWLETIEVEDSAHPYHDWNERILAECYAPNSAARIVDGKNRILKIVSNYDRMSFNFGPTLLAWLETHAPHIYGRILDADKTSGELFGGHGNALAQAFNHIIMPLASRRDKITQVIWGMRDFQRRFGREPEGIWLPETAVDSETLEVLAEQGIRFTILAPTQARRIRPLAGGAWQNVEGGRIETRRCYRANLRGGRSIALFFYDGDLSHGVAFGQILNSGDEFITRIRQRYAQDYPEDQLVHLSTDGETYGHHHRFGEMALAYTLENISSNGDILITNYGQFLAEHPPRWEVEIVERTSWSCAHGVERWRADCGCRIGTDPCWNQAWRAPLREALDWLKGRLDEIYDKKGRTVLGDPWKARNAYIDVILDRSAESVERFFAGHASPIGSAAERVRLLQMMEMQRNAMLMFASDGWFFDEISGLETVHILKYAARAMQLAAQVTGVDMENEFVSRLSRAQSNVPAMGDGANVYVRMVKPSVVTLKRVIAHYAINSLFEEYKEKERIYCFTVQRENYLKSSRGGATLAVGQVSATCCATEEEGRFIFAVLYAGGYDFRCSLLPAGEEIRWDKLNLVPTLERAGITELIRGLDQMFGTDYMTLRDLFLEERRAIAQRMIEDAIQRFESNYRTLYNENRDLMRFLREIDAPIPVGFKDAAQVVLKLDLKDALEKFLRGEPSETISAIMEEAELWGIDPWDETIEQRIRSLLEKRLHLLTMHQVREHIPEIAQSLELADRLGISLNLWEAQNIFWQTLNGKWNTAQTSPPEDWELFVELGERLGFNLAAFRNFHGT